jgi:hypothetical protein
MPVLLFFCCSNLYAQNSLALKDSLSVTADTAVSFYYKFTDQRSRLYNGKEYIGYPQMEGHPFFGDPDLHRGSVFYDGLLFDSVNMQYDLVKDELIIQHFDVFFKIVLISSKVKEFTLSNHHYRRMVKDSVNRLPVSTGYYDFLYEGNITLIAKRTKHIDELVTDKIVRKIVEKNFYYVIRDSVYYPIRSYKSLLSLFKDKSKEIRQDLRRNHLKFRKNREGAIVRAVKFYDSSKK